jgi:hypothetical protein
MQWSSIVEVCESTVEEWGISEGKIATDVQRAACNELVHAEELK